MKTTDQCETWERASKVKFTILGSTDDKATRISPHPVCSSVYFLTVITKKMPALVNMWWKIEPRTLRQFLEGLGIVSRFTSNNPEEVRF